MRSVKIGRKVYLAVSEAGKRVVKKALCPGAEYCIGRERGKSDIILADPSVSRRHCYVLYDKEAKCLWVKDVSSNGCALSGGTALIHGVYVKVRPGEEILITNTDYRLSVIPERKRVWPGKG